MRRDNVDLEVVDVAWLAEGAEPRQPTLDVRVDDGASTLRERLLDDGAPIESSDVDVTFRLHGSTDGSDVSGVVAITNRVTGEYILEVNGAADEVAEFVSAARRYGERTDDSTRYRIRLTADGESLADLQKRTLLVYSSDGELLRQHSLIPSGVEI